MVDIALIGTGGMMPLPGRFLTALVCRANGSMALVDCGEGTQVTLKILGWGFKNIDSIFFTHYHADHISGLPGLLLTIGNSGREEPLKLYGPPGLGGVVKALTYISPVPYDLHIYEIKPDQEIIAGEFLVRCLPVEHRMPCYAYSFEMKRKGKFDVEKAKALNLPVQFWSRLQKSDQVEFEGRLYTPDMVLGPERKGIKVCYATDTRPVKTLPDFVRGADLFVCEGIYGEDEKLDKAKVYKHMLFSEAARLALAGEVKEMWLTHFSPSLTDPDSFLPVAREIFPKTKVGRDRMTKTILFEDE